MNAVNKDNRKTGRVTIPTDVDVVPETLELMKRWGADAVRDCDGTDYPEELKGVDAKVYSTYYTTRKDNDWAKANPDEIQQMYLMTPHRTAVSDTLSIHLMEGLYPDMLAVNSRDDIRRWWEVIDRTTGEIVPAARWSYREETGDVTIQAEPYHEYTVSFLAYIMWDPVHMYNAVTNDWKGVEHQITFDVRQPKTHAFTMQRLRRFIKEHPYVDVIRFTTFFHQFTLVFDEQAREKYVDWYGYSASVSPYILEQFEREVGYPFRPEYIIDQGYMNNTYRVPSKEFRDFQAFQRREVAKLAKEMVDITHEMGKEAMMFLGDHWIGTEPFMPEFQTIGLDAVVGSVGNGATLRLISDIPGVKYTEGRFLPYFFPDTFHEGGDPVREAKVNWVTARRAILRKPIDRIGYGGYLKLALEFPDFIAYVQSVCDEFRELYENIRGTTPYCVKKVAVLNCWGKMRAWGNHMVHHAIYYKQNYSYAGVIEALSGAPFDVRFLSFDDIRANPAVLDEVDVVLNVGDAYTAYSGGENWCDPAIVSALRRFVHRGGGLIGVGEPTACQHEGRYFQLAGVLGVEQETGLTLSLDKYNWQEHDHFITADCGRDIDFGEGKKNIYALPEATVIRQIDKGVQLAANEFGGGRSVYISGLPYSFENSRLLYRAILWASHGEKELHRWFSDNYNVEVHAYVKNGKYCVVNNTYEPQSTVVYRGDGSSFALDLDANEIRWYETDAEE
ncbi:MAG TPA: 1,3-beta-galactosyl-N-acetylhexosamine phosphorylase [Firmicutes bacterium]|nr:1,3-beta-galactosyl-N-acetylhexosamine phosphorylase [Bacillota bacterium]